MFMQIVSYALHSKLMHYIVKLMHYIVSNYIVISNFLEKSGMGDQSVHGGMAFVMPSDVEKEPISVNAVPLSPPLSGEALRPIDNFSCRVVPARQNKKSQKRFGANAAKSKTVPVHQDADAALNTLSYFGEHTMRTRIQIDSIKALLKPHTQKPELVNDLVLNCALASLEEAFVTDFRRGLQNVWRRGVAHGAWLREGEVRSNEDAQQAALLLRMKLEDLERRNSALQLMYDEAMAELKIKSGEVADDNQLNLVEMQEYVDSLFDNDEFVGAFTGDIAELS